MSKFKKIIFSIITILVVIIAILFFAKVMQINDEKIIEEKSKIIADADYAIIKKQKKIIKI